MPFDDVHHIDSVEQLESILTTPPQQIIDALSTLDGDLMILGVGGKMGPTLAKLARRVTEQIGLRKKIIGVSRFTSSEIKSDLDASGIETITCDLLNEESLAQFPDVPNVVFMAGRKFGSTGNESLTWMMNTYLPGIIMKRFRHSNIVALSTGNVYPFVPIASGGSREADKPNPIGEYAQSCLGRERLIQYFSEQHKIPVTIVRLNYAVDLRYGVLLDIAQKVFSEEAIDLRMGYFNAIWQGDANSAIILAFQLCSTPPIILNVTGRETISVRSTAKIFGELLHHEPRFINEETDTALLSNAEIFHQKFNFQKVSLDQMIQWIAHWVKIGGATYNKPTHFDEREGKF